MSQAATVTWLAVRELWITFRLLIVLVAFVGAGAVVALLPAPPAVALQRLAAGMALATVVVCVVAAWSIATERTSGRAGWLITRSVSRGTYLTGWFGALAGVTMVGIGGGAVLGWLASSGMLPPIELDAFSAATLAVTTAALTGLALGLVIGTVAPPPVAVALAAVTAALLGLGAWMVPGTAYRLLPEVATSSASLPAGLRAAGIGLVMAALLFAVARVAMERAEL